MRLQVFGYTGMLGQAVVRAARAAGHTVLMRKTRIEMVWQHDVQAPTVLNCAGLTKQHDSTYVDFMNANAYGPYNLAEACDNVGARLIHISTDCVFEGVGPHTEKSAPDATDIYAISKRAGEVTYGPHLTLRTSFVGFGPRGLLHDLQTQSSVRVSRNLLWTGHTVDTIAQLLVSLVDRPHVVGLVHIPGTEQNRYTLACNLKTRWQLPAVLEQDDGFVADRRLTSDRWECLGLPTLPPFNEQLTTMRGPE